MEAPRRPWSLPSEEVVKALGVNPEPGLSEAEVRARTARFGPNRLREAATRGAWEILGAQFKSLIVGLLAAAAIVSFAFGDWVEGVAILVVILINAAIGFFTELRAVRSMEALRRMGGVHARVRRDGRLLDISAEDLAPGDIVVLEGGDVVTADVRLLTASRLQADESALTGESMPVAKAADPVPADTVLAERRCMLYKGTSLTRGSGEGLVVSTGMDTELGHISALVESAEQESTPLEKRLDRLGHRLIGVTLGIAAVVAVAGILTGKEVFLMIETGIALAVAAIPEGLPIVATLALARGMYRMARRNALINRLSAVETLGATSIICVDKTGTLTENRLTVDRFVLPTGEVEFHPTTGAFTLDGQAFLPADHEVLREALEISVLCNNASLGEDGKEGVGDPLEVALLASAKPSGLTRDGLAAPWPERREEAFDSDVKMMATFHRDGAQNGAQDGAGLRVAVKGAPESVLTACSRARGAEGEGPFTEADRREWLARNDALAGEGLRVLALAGKVVDREDAPAYEDLTFVGLVALLDPPRADVNAAIARCRASGVRVIMATGDQAVTARNIALSVGLVDDPDAAVVNGRDLEEMGEPTPEEEERLAETSIFARVSPKDKLDLVDLHQRRGAVVAMTGDGVNDAPALKKADIGVAMGLRGTEVARQAADMVLKDDAFSTIVMAVEQGRAIFDNIRRFVLYLLSCNVSEILIVGIASILNVPLPILPLQILFLNLVTDVFPALALGMGEGGPRVMDHPPRDPEEPIVGRAQWRAIAGFGVVITLSVFGALALAILALGATKEEAVTISFLTLAFVQIWHVFNMREPGTRFLKNNITRNPFIWAALVLCAGLLLIAVYVPGLASVMKLTPPSGLGWLVVIGMSLVPWVVGQVVLAARGRRPEHSAT